MLIQAQGERCRQWLGWRQRRVGVAALQADSSDRRPLIRLAMGEALIFGLTFGVAVALGRTPPPAPRVINPSAVEVAIGYDLAGPPTVLRVLLDWRFDLLFGTLALVFAGVYIAGVVRLRRRGDQWPTGRLVAWLLGCAALLFATSSGIGRYMPAMFSMHMAAHMLLSMLVPILLALGAPTTALSMLQVVAQVVETALAARQGTAALAGWDFNYTLDSIAPTVFETFMFHWQRRVLAELEGLTAQEISDGLRLNINTVYTRLRAARQRFAEFVADHHARERGADHA